MQFSADGRRCEQARIALAAVAPTAVRAREAEEFLAGKTPDQDDFTQAGELAARAAKPISDVRGSAAYRIELVKVLDPQKSAEGVGESQRTVNSLKNKISCQQYRSSLWVSARRRRRVV